MEHAAVRCPVCGEPGLPGKRFCADCGTALPLLCSSCGAELLPNKRFCADCGAAVTAATAVTVLSGPPAAAPTLAPIVEPAPAPPVSHPPSEERRLVTALFCDLVGFTPLSESLDPEEVRDVQAEYFEAMSAQIERYGGIVEKYAGDAVLALFGAPIAHEDDAERAVLCALGMQAAIEPVAATARARWQVEPSIRVGVNTGEVVSGTWNASGRQDVAVTGDAVNTAARIQAAAEAGEILVGLETMRLTRRRIHYGERRELTLKGKVGTVPGYPAIGVREQFGERWETSESATPLVGREREMLELLDAWIRSQGGDGQLVTVVGDAGVGKSRLISELLEKVGTSGAIRVVRARSLSYGQEISLWLMADLLRGLFGIREQETLDEVHAKVHVAVIGLLSNTDKETQAEAIDVLGEVLGLPAGSSIVANAGAQIRRQALIRDLRLLLGALTERAPTVLVLEDLHWIDEASAEVLTEVLSDVPGLRLLVLSAQRPGWSAPWTDWGWTERLTLRPLRDEEATLLAGAVLGGMKLSPELEQYVAERAGGNPFFVEEMLRSLQETGGLERRNGAMYLAPGAAERLPSTLTEVLLARLDRLEGQVRSVAQVASVIGRSFAVRLLAQVMEREAAALDMPLTALQQAEIAFPRRGSDLEYVFKHVSMREVAYNTLIQKRRQELHLATARAIAALYPSDEYVEIIAYHFGRTEEHGEAGEWLERAGERAAGVYANETAIGNYEESRRRLELAGAEEIDLARIDEKLGTVLTTVRRYDQALTALDRAVDVYRRVRDLEAAGRVTAKIGRVHFARGTAEEGIATVQPALDLLTWSGPSHGLASLHVALAHLLFASGRYRESADAAVKASEIARAIGDDRILADAEVRRGGAIEAGGRWQEARHVLEDSISFAESVGDLEILSRGLNNLAEAHLVNGALEESRKSLERALIVSERVGDPGDTAYELAQLGWCIFLLGDWSEARAYLQRGVDMTRTVSSSWFSAYPLLYLGQLDLAEGNWEQALERLIESIAIAHRSDDLQALRQAEPLAAEKEILENRPDLAKDRLQQLVDRFGLGDEVAHALPAFAWAQLEAGDVFAAQETANRAVERATAQQNRVVLVEALRIQGIVASRQERWQETERHFEDAASMAKAMSYPYAEARVLYEWGRMNVQRAQLQQAREKLRAALEIFQRLGARKDAERTEQALADFAQIGSIDRKDRAEA